MSGAIIKISGPTVVARGMEQARMFNRVAVGQMGLLGEVIRLRGGEATIQVYEETTGLTLGEEVQDAGEPLLVELGPGLLGSVFDGVQRPLEVIVAEHGDWIARGLTLPALPRAQRWSFSPTVRPGALVGSGDCLGVVQETERIQHRVLVPPGMSGRVLEILEGAFRVTEPIARLDGDRPLAMLQRWPVRVPRPVGERLAPVVPFITGQRVFDMLFPIAAGGTVIVPGGFGTGKCVSGDTPVLLDDGTLILIQDLFEAYRVRGQVERSRSEEFIPLNPGPKVISFNGEGFVSRSCSGLYRGRTDALVLVRTRSGRVLRVTPAHRLFVVTPELAIQEVEAGKLQVGDFLATPRRITLQAGIQRMDYGDLLDQFRVCDRQVLAELPRLIAGLTAARRITLKELAREVGYPYYMVRHYTKGRNRPPVAFIKALYALAGHDPVFNQVKAERQSAPVRLPQYLDGDFAEFLGLLLADGNLRQNTVMFYNNDETLLARFEALAQRLFDLTGHRGVANTVRCVQLHSTVLTKLLIHLGVPRSGARKSRTCKAPEVVMCSPDSHLQRFLAAYFACDGHVAASGKELEFTTASHAMQIGLSYLLLRLGILHQVRQRRIKGRPYYRVMIRGKDEVGRFYRACVPQGWISPKFEAIAAYLRDGKKGYTATDIVPISAHLFQEVYETLERPHAALERRGVNPSNFLNGKFRMTARTFKAFADYMQIPSLTSFSRSLEHIFCDPIIEIKTIPGPVSVYDVTVPDTHNFVGGESAALFHNTVVEQTLAKYARADIIVYIGCGERGNEMTEILAEFPRLSDPATGLPLMQRTILVINTSNMPVAARETSIYTGITLAEYYRDMGYAVALMADSTSRWAEATREISARLEEMPGEEGYPTYLATKLAGFYERGGRVRCLGQEPREGSVTIVSAISPPGGDFSEPVTQSSMLVAGGLWALDSDLAHRRHFPAINWKRSFSLYTTPLDPWFRAQVAPDWPQLRTELTALLQKEEELQEIVQLVGIDALQDQERAVLEVSRLVREEYLRQNAYSETDAACPLEKQYWMLRALLQFFLYCRELLKRGRTIEQLLNSPFRAELERMKETPPDSCVQQARAMIEKMEQELGRG